MKYAIVCRNDPQMKGTDLYLGLNDTFTHDQEAAQLFFSWGVAREYAKRLVPPKGHLPFEVCSFYENKSGAIIGPDGKGNASGAQALQNLLNPSIGIPAHLEQRLCVIENMLDGLCEAMPTHAIADNGALIDLFISWRNYRNGST